MATLNDVKTFGGIGSILTLLGIVPSAGGILAIIGLVMILVAVKYASDILGDPKIFNNMLYAVILGIIGLMIGIVTVVAAVLKAIGLGSVSGSFYVPALTGVTVTASTGVTVGQVTSIVAVILLGLVAVWVCFLISSIFLRRSYTELGKRLNVGLFDTGALLYLIGAALTIILVGFILIFIAEVLFVIAFFSIDTQAAPQAQSARPTM